MAWIYPRRFGQQKSQHLELIIKSLNDARGSAYNPVPGSIAYAEDQAKARAIWAMWNDNKRLSNQIDPLRMTDFLSRWEKIFNLTVLPGETDNQRRAKV